jgi:2-keto-myo-inositol isomerase
MIARALNQRTAPYLPYEAFLDLAVETGCIGVEPRTDLDRPLFDGIPAAEAGKLARQKGLRLIGLSEVYPFNDWSDERAQAIQSLINNAQEAGAETISLIPRVDGVGAEDGVRQIVLRESMRRVLPMLEGKDVVALIEPIGFRGSSLRYKAELVEAIEAVGGSSRFKLIHDTFQHTIAGDLSLFGHYTGLVHISGLSDPSVILDESQDGHRVFVDASDRCDTTGQIEALLEAGYSGPFSFECTEPDVQSSTRLRSEIMASFEYIEDQVGVALI